MKKKVLTMLVLSLLLAVGITSTAWATGGDIDVPSINIKDTIKESAAYKSNTARYMVYDVNDPINAPQELEYTVPKDGVTMLIFFGAGQCNNSEGLFSEMATSNWANNDKINIIAVATVESVGVPNKELVQSFIEKTGCANVVDKFYYNTTGMLSMSYINLLPKGFGGQLPYVFFITKGDDGNYIKSCMSGINSAALVGNYLNQIIGTDYDTASKVSVTVQGKQRYDYVDEVIRRINISRGKEGADPVTYSKKLTEFAMQRAAECALYYSHERPDHSKKVVTLPGAHYAAENIGVGYATPEAAMEGWLNSPGHKANIVDERFTFVGIGCFENNENLYWVQVFGDGTDEGILTQTTSIPVDAKVDTLTTYLNPFLASNKEIKIKVGETGTLPLLYNNNPLSQWNDRTIILPIVSDVTDSTDSSAVIAKAVKGADGTGLINLTETVKGTGKATLSAYLNEENPKTVNVKIGTTSGGGDEPAKPVAVNRVTLNKTTLTLAKGAEETLTATVKPDKATDKTVTWTSSKPEVATVDANGRVTAVAAGEATITATAGEKTATCKVTVTGPTIALDSSALTVVVGSEPKLKLTAAVTGAANTVTWTSSDETVATVANGEITGVKAGTATITATLTEDATVKAECLVTVKENPEQKAVYTLTFDADGGELTGATKAQVLAGEKYALPKVTKAGYNFRGWQAGDDTKLLADGAEYEAVADTVFKAVWKKKSSGGSSSGGGSSSKPNDDKKDDDKKADVKPNDDKKDETKPTDSKITASNIDTVFADVKPGQWYDEAVAYVYNNGIMKGTDNGGFAPNTSTTRGQIATMLYRLENEPAAGAVNFTDVKPGQWYAPAVAWAAEQKIVSGYANGAFGAEDNVTREQLAAILYRYAEAKQYDVTAKKALTGFSDGAAVSGWAAEAMQWAVGSGLLNGSDGALNPQGYATRAEIAAILMRFCENIAK